MTERSGGEGRMRRGFRLVRESGRVLIADPELLVLAFLGMAASIAISLGLFVLFFGHVPTWEDLNGSRSLLVFPIFAVGSIVPTFTNAAIVGEATIRLEGGEPTLRDGVRLAASKFPKLLRWWLVSVVVGYVLHAVLERFRLAGRVLSFTLGLAWYLATIFVIPILLYEPVGALQAVKRSASLFKERWGEEVAGTGAIGTAALVVLLPVQILLLVVTFAAGVSPQYFFVAWLVTFMATMVPVAALTSIFNAALYRYATDGIALGPFTASELEHAYEPKPKRVRRWLLRRDR